MALPHKNCAPDASGRNQGWSETPLMAWLQDKNDTCFCEDDPCNSCVERARLIGELRGTLPPAASQPDWKKDDKFDTIPLRSPASQPESATVRDAVNAYWDAVDAAMPDRVPGKDGTWMLNAAAGRKLIEQSRRIESMEQELATERNDLGRWMNKADALAAKLAAAREAVKRWHDHIHGCEWAGASKLGLLSEMREFALSATQPETKETPPSSPTE